MSIKYYSKAVVSSLVLTAAASSSAFAGAPSWFDSKKQMCQDLAYYQGFQLDYTKAPSTKVGLSAGAGGYEAGVTFEVQPVGFSKEKAPGNAYCCIFTVDAKLLAANLTNAGNAGCGNMGDQILLETKGDGGAPMFPIQTFLKVKIKAGSGIRDVTKIADDIDLSEIKKGNIKQCSSTVTNNCWFKNKVSYDPKEGDAYTENMTFWQVGAGVIKTDDTQTKVDFWHNYSKKPLKVVPKSILQSVTGLRDRVNQ